MFSLIVSSPPTQNQVANSIWLSKQIYDGINTMNTDSGCIIKSHESDLNGAYVIWKHLKTKECFVVIRGTKTWSDFITDLKVEDIYDEEIGVHVHKGVQLRESFILSDISDKLSECKRDIIITGHSLGGSISHYLFLKYVHKHYYNWQEPKKAHKFKAVIFGAPQLTSKSNSQLLINFEKNIAWYKYENDLGPELIRTAKGCCFFHICPLLGDIGQAVCEKLLPANYGDYIPGNKYNLWFTGITEPYTYIFGKNSNLEDHIDLSRTYNAILKNGWGIEDLSYDDSDNVNCLQLGITQFLDEERITKIEENSSVKLSDNDDGTINIDTIECENVDEYNKQILLQDVFLYTKDNSYIIKRILENQKEYEYALCSDNGFFLKQCDSQCNCHPIFKNNRPKNITMCTSYQLDSVMFCSVDGVYQQVELTEYFGLLGQTKIQNYYLMDYLCQGEIYQRGNYKNNSKSKVVSLNLLFLILILLY